MREFQVGDSVGAGSVAEWMVDGVAQRPHALMIMPCLESLGPRNQHTGSVWWLRMQSIREMVCVGHGALLENRPPIRQGPEYSAPARQPHVMSLDLRCLVGAYVGDAEIAHHLATEDLDNDSATGT